MHVLDETLFSCLNSSLPPCALQGVCLLALCACLTVLPCLDAACFGWPCFGQQARPSHQSFSSSSSSTRSLLLLPFPPIHHSIYLPSLDNDSQHGRHGRDCSKRKVRGSDRVEALLQPLSWCDCPWWFSCSFACLPPPLLRTEAACGSHTLPCVMPAPSPAVVCPPSARSLGPCLPS